MKISIIIPIYNMEQYVADALDSILIQTLKDVEIICIDDGSTDDSLLILKDYSKKYENIVVLRQKNSGSGVARNLGITIASGEYVCFLDADDFYASDDVLEYLYNTAKRQDVLLCGGSSCDYHNGKISTNAMRVERRFENDEYISKEDYPGFTGYCSFIFNRNFLICNDIKFPEYKRGQDAPFFMKAIECAGGAFCVSKIIYVYRKEHKKTIYDTDKALDLVKSCRDLLLIANRNKMYNVQRECINELMGVVGAVAYLYAYHGSEEMNSLIRECNRIVNKDILEQTLGRSDKLFLEGEDLIKYVNDNMIEKKSFLDDLKKKEEIYIFGAGTVGRKVALYLKENNIKVTSFIVSDKSKNDSEIDGIAVNETDFIQVNKKYTIIIATFWFSQDKIIKMLHKYGIGNIYPIDLKRFFLWQGAVEH